MRKYRLLNGEYDQLEVGKVYGEKFFIRDATGFKVSVAALVRVYPNQWREVTVDEIEMEERVRVIEEKMVLIEEKIDGLLDRLAGFEFSRELGHTGYIVSNHD